MTGRYAKTRLLSLLEFEAAPARFVAASVKHRMTHLAKDSTTPGHVEEERVHIVCLQHEAKVSQANNVARFVH